MILNWELLIKKTMYRGIKVNTNTEQECVKRWKNAIVFSLLVSLTHRSKIKVEPIVART